MGGRQIQLFLFDVANGGDFDTVFLRKQIAVQASASAVTDNTYLHIPCSLTYIVFKDIIAENIVVFNDKIADREENVAMGVFYEPQRDVEDRVSSMSYKSLSALLHFHRSIELIYVRSGVVRVRSGMREFLVGADEIAFVPAYFAHSAESVEPGGADNFIIPYNYYKQFAARGVPLYYSHLADKEVNRQILQVIIQAQPNIKDRRSDLLAHGYAEVVLGLISRYYRSDNIKTGDNEFVIRVINYIDQNFKADLSLDNVSAHFKYSKYYFSRLFNRAFGCNLNRYINQVRYNYVVSNYKEGQNLSAVILEAGFNDISTFYKFKRRSGGGSVTRLTRGGVAGD